MIGQSPIGSAANALWWDTRRPPDPPVFQPVTEGYLQLAGLIAHITAHNLSLGEPWREVGFSADLAYVEANDRVTAPAVYVIPGDEASADASDMKVIRQIINCSVGVVTVLRNYRISDRGQAAVDDHGPLRQRLRDHIIGFKPAGFSNTLRHTKGRLIRYTDEFLFYVDEFAADFHFRKLIH